MSRSLRASPTGTRAARLKLEYRNLSQRAFAQELAFSWSTVSKFFNGKPVDRSYFTEICEALELEWEDIALMPDAVDVSDLLDHDRQPPAELHFEQRDRLQATSDRLRRALDPYVLQAIPRQTLLDRCLRDIDRTERGQPCIISILGEAGYGKSTFLGSVYDALQGRRDRRDRRDQGDQPKLWLGLVRCDDLIDGSDRLSQELSERLLGKTERGQLALPQLIAQTKPAAHPGVLLLDTLDIILSRSLVASLRQLLPQLLDLNVSVLFTCRDRDYCDFFEPYHQSFAGFRNEVAELRVPAFSDDEIRTAVDRFLQTQAGYDAQERRDRFAENLLDLSADRSSLREIVANPLLLALCCDLFAATGTIPEDLTVSQLYDTYWSMRIIRTRQADPQLGRQKSRLCLNLARQLWHTSVDRLRDFAYSHDLEIAPETETAYQALLSDGVLKDIGNDRLAFFHQTFLEYAIARWLTSTTEGETARPQFLQDAIDTPETLPYFRWAIGRQLLTLLAAGEFQDWLALWPLQFGVPFRTLTLAAIARPQTELAANLAMLHQFARDRDGTFHATLLIALNSLPRQCDDIAWTPAIELLERVDGSLTNRATETCALWLARSGDRAAARLDRVLTVIRDRQDDGQELALLGQFLHDYDLQLRQQTNDRVDRGVLEILRDRYFEFGTYARSKIIALHDRPGVRVSDVFRLLETILTVAPSPTYDEREATAQLLQRVLPPAIAAGDTFFGASWESALRVAASRIEGRWSAMLAETIAIACQENRAVLERLCDRLWDATADNCDYRLTVQTLKQAARASMAEPPAISCLLMRQPADLTTSRLPSVCDLVRALSDLSAELKGRVVAWLLPEIDRQPVQVILALDECIGDDRDLRDVLGERLRVVLPQLSAKSVANILKKLRSVPPAIVPWLQDLGTKEARRLLVRRSDEIDDVTALVLACGDESKDVAQLAARLLRDGVDRDRFPEDFVKLAAIASCSPYVGVRLWSVEIVKLAIQAGRLASEKAVSCLERFMGDKTEEVCQQVISAVDAIVWREQKLGEQVSAGAVRLGLAMLDRAIAEPRFHRPLARVSFLLLAQMALCDRAEWWPAIAVRARGVLGVSNLSKLDNKLVTGILARVAKVDMAFLGRIVREDCIAAAEPLPSANQLAVVMAIVAEFGAGSDLLDALLGHGGTPDMVKVRIYRARGL